MLMCTGKRNKSGYYRVSIKKSTHVKQGFYYEYSYPNGGNRKTIKSVDIRKLEEKVKSKGLPWRVINPENARLTNEKNNARIHNNKTGFFRLNKNKSLAKKQGFIWRYKYKDGDKYKTISRTNLTELYEYVLKKGLPWYITDQKLAMKSIEENRKNFPDSD